MAQANKFIIDGVEIPLSGGSGGIGVEYDEAEEMIVFSGEGSSGSPSGSSSGNSNEEFRFLGTIVLDESTFTYSIDKDENGNAFSLTELILYSPSFTSGSNYVGVDLNQKNGFNASTSFKSWYGTTAKMLFSKYTVLGTNIAESFPIGHETLKQRDFKTNCLGGKNKIESFLLFFTVAPVTGETIDIYGR